LTSMQQQPAPSLPVMAHASAESPQEVPVEERSETAENEDLPAEGFSNRARFGAFGSPFRAARRMITHEPN
jgi:hypothetical protein